MNSRTRTLIIIRHAPTGANRKGVFMGHRDAPNSSSGLRAAEALGKRFRGSEGLRLFTSPLRRSTATIDLIVPKKTKIVDERLIERGLGLWEGCAKASVMRDYPMAFGPNGTLDPLFKPPDGESIEDLVRRVCNFLIDISESKESADALCVTHNGVIAVMRSLLERRPLRHCFAEVEPFLRPRRYTYRVNENLQHLREILAASEQKSLALYE